MKNIDNSKHNIKNTTVIEAVCFCVSSEKDCKRRGCLLKMCQHGNDMICTIVVMTIDTETAIKSICQ